MGVNGGGLASYERAAEGRFCRSGGSRMKYPRERPVARQAGFIRESPLGPILPVRPQSYEVLQAKGLLSGARASYERALRGHFAPWEACRMKPRQTRRLRRRSTAPRRALRPQASAIVQALRDASPVSVRHSAGLARTLGFVSVHRTLAPCGFESPQRPRTRKGPVAGALLLIGARSGTRTHTPLGSGF